ncbi:hypothetical protein GCM10023194_81080 [Planotetraspora phitsanulokensis]|uniref:PIN domain-containing protein n=1 Tax=Planotetraspora phitsanulokensis TaxID=575192 RepID=A0A8J3UIE8_9ACTN|nr:hypothetical protein [Planotetraspora phitsanulokensis]GII42869.1 hypothetical protein Pph01_78720 [Planotetraspora phitsanulokensis]
MSDYTPTPVIIDTTVLHEIVRGEVGVISLIQGFDADGQPMVVSALAITAALMDARNEEAADAMHGLAAMENVTVAPLKDAEQAENLALVAVVTGLDVVEAHTAAIADVSVCPILTLNAARWEEPSAALEERLFTIEIAEP